jgi:hypothetical protein
MLSYYVTVGLRFRGESLSLTFHGSTIHFAFQYTKVLCTDFIFGHLGKVVTLV